MSSSIDLLLLIAGDYSSTYVVKKGMKFHFAWSSQDCIFLHK